MLKEPKYGEMEALTLEKVPEIRKSYYEFGWEPIPYPTDEWLEELKVIPLEDPRRLGASILFESILTPFVLSLFADEARNQYRIREILDWIEALAQHKDTRVRETLVGVCFCEVVLTRSNLEQVTQVLSQLGPKTKAICREHADRLNLRESFGE